MIRSVTMILALAATSSASFLPFLARQADEFGAEGFFRRRSGTLITGFCPSNITHKEGPTNSEIAHTEILMSGLGCNAGRSLSILSKNELLAAVDASDSRNTINDFSDRVEGNIIYGLEREGRECTPPESARTISEFSADTVILIFKPDKDVRVNFVQFTAGKTAMVTLDPIAGPCYFVKEKPPVTPPGKEPTPLPETTPSPGEAIEEPSPEMSPDVSPDAEDEDEDDEDDGSVCFPADATVDLEDGTTKTMAEINLGDSVKVGDGQFSDVFMFTHKDAKRLYKFVTMHTDSGAVLSATPGHYIYVNGKLAAAKSVVVGDSLQLANGQATLVTGVERVRKVGLYNPQTLHGDIVVNSLKASTFTRTVNPPSAQALMAPLRHMYSLIGWSGSFLDGGADCIAPYVPHGSMVL